MDARTANIITDVALRTDCFGDGSILFVMGSHRRLRIWRPMEKADLASYKLRATLRNFAFVPMPVPAPSVARQRARREIMDCSSIPVLALLRSSMGQGIRMRPAGGSN